MNGVLVVIDKLGLALVDAEAQIEALLREREQLREELARATGEPT